MPKKIRFIKICDEGKPGDIKNYSNGSADSLVEQGYAEYVSESQIKPNNSKKKSINDTNDTNLKTPKSSIGNEGQDQKNTEKNKVLCDKPNNSKKTENEIEVMIRDINDTNDTNDTLNISNVSKVSRITDLRDAFGFGVFESILAIFYLKNNPKLNYNQISEQIENTTNYTKVVIYRNQEYFQEVDRQDGKKLFQLSTLGINYCKKQVENYEQRLHKAEQELRDRDKEKLNSEELFEEVSKIISETEPLFEGKRVTFDFEKIAEWNIKFSEYLLENPEEILSILGNQVEERGFNDVRIKNLPKTEIIPVEKVRCEHIGKLICIEGRCVSLSSVRPVVTQIKYECPSCGTIISVLQLEKRIMQPSRCCCGRRGGFKELSKDMVDTAIIILEDLQEKTDNPNTQRLEGVIKGQLTSPDNIQTFTPGEEIRVIGIVKEVKKEIAGSTSVMFGLALEIVHAEKIEEEIDLSNLSEKEVDEIKNLCKKINENGMREINSSFSPDVYGYESIKDAIILQCCNKRNQPKKSATRNKISILMIGDPGIAKTVLGKFAISITPHSKMASGGGSSAVGITASVVKEDESMGGYRVEPGAMVLAKELLFLDEMNNLSDEDKPKLQQGMSEQKIDVNKANIHVSLKVQGGILATANPIKGNFMEGIEVSKQFNIPSPILNRFDVIFVMRDLVNTERDEAITEIMIKRRRNEIKPKYDREFLRNFFAYIRQLPEPIITDDITQEIKKIYSNSRKTNGNSVIINPRFIESLTRLMEASAKIRGSDKVEQKDIKTALKILSQSHFKTNEYKAFNLPSRGLK